MIIKSCIPTDFNPFDMLRMSFLTLPVLSALIPAVLPMDPTRGTNPLKTILVNYALIEPVLFHAVLFAAAVHEDTLLNRKTNLETLRQRGEMIRLINEALNSPNSATSDATVAAVVLTSANEASPGGWLSSVLFAFLTGCRSWLGIFALWKST